MSDSREVISQKLKARVYSFYQSLTSKNIDNLQKFFTNEAILSWGPYKFVGKENILSWAKELWELFPILTIQEKSIEVYGTMVKHEFVLAFTTQEGRNGWLPCESLYKFKNDEIFQLDINLKHGYVAVNRDEIERVKPHPTK
jgi:hypothetical protein